MQPWPLLVTVVSGGVQKKAKGIEEDSREDETVTVQPVGVLGVELHELVEKDVGNGCHAPAIGVSKAVGSRGIRQGELTWEHRGVPSCWRRWHQPAR